MAEGATMETLPIEHIVEGDLSADGETVSLVAELADGSRCGFAISFRNADWLAQHILRLSRVAIERQAAAGKAPMLAGATDQLIVTEHRVSVMPGVPQALVMAVGHWASSEDAGGATALLLDRQRAQQLAEELAGAAQTLPQMTRKN
jgi:hypothetical protein